LSVEKVLFVPRRKELRRLAYSRSDSSELRYRAGFGQFHRHEGFEEGINYPLISVLFIKG
jgi:hypothetical protein